MRKKFETRNIRRSRGKGSNPLSKDERKVTQEGIQPLAKESLGDSRPRRRHPCAPVSSLPASLPVVRREGVRPFSRSRS
jgi:hypothetical protein